MTTPQRALGGCLAFYEANKADHRGSWSSDAIDEIFSDEAK